MTAFKIKPYNEGSKAGIEALLGTSVEMNEKISIDFTVDKGASACTYNLLDREVVVSFEVKDISVTDEDGNEVTLETLHDYVYTMDFGGDKIDTYTAAARPKPASVVDVATHIFNVILRDKRDELGLNTKAPRKASDSRISKEKLAAEKLLLAQLRAKKKASNKEAGLI